jgi:DNA primase
MTAAQKRQDAAMHGRTVEPVDVEALKRRFLLSEIVARDVELKRAGREFVGLCPFHAENTPSFRVNDAKGVYFCFGCSASGDLVDYLREREGLDFAGALRWLGAEAPARERPRRSPAEDRAEREAAVTQARAIWRRSRPLAGTPAEAYLRSRGIKSAPGSVRFARVALWRDPETGRAGRWTPALVAACQDAGGRVTGIQRVCLTPEGQKAGRKAKLSLGQVRGGALRLGPPAAHLVLCEGPEDGLTLWQRSRGRSSIWVSLGTCNLHAVVLPDAVEAVTIAGDNNPAGRAAAEVAAEAYAAQGRRVRIVYPGPDFADWNDELLGRRRDAV